MNTSFSSTMTLPPPVAHVAATLTLLVVEDNEDEAFILNRFLAESGMVSFLHTVDDGEEAVRYLQGLEKYSNRTSYPLPDVIVTDLKMSGMGGMGVLKWLKSHPAFFVIPVIVFTSSERSSDIQSAYALGANAYMVRPPDPERWEEMVKITLGYWGSCRTPLPMPN